MSIDNEKDLEGLLRAGRVVALTLQEMEQAVRPGMTTAELDAIGEAVMKSHGARSAPQVVYRFPGATCISVNEEAVHGIPGPRVLQPGDVVKLDVTVELDGYVADAAKTVVLPPVSEEKRRLQACAEAALEKGLAAARAGQPLHAIGKAVETEVERRGFRVLRELFSHGVGRTIHEEPHLIPNYEDRRIKTRLTNGMVITVEPIIAVSSRRTAEKSDGWTVRTADFSLAAHAEHSIVITKGKPLILTAL
ncbi:MAG TPA: type I methionyl aminopeptidase [Chloroflexota bacterium]|nr:type I methionyl aminopeptidase [Chloroflexota bacterium]